MSFFDKLFGKKNAMKQNEQNTQQATEMAMEEQESDYSCDKIIAEAWTSTANDLQASFEKKDGIISLSFISEEIEVEPDNYGGISRKYYYSNDDSNFHSYLFHWDGGNMFANRAYNDCIISIGQIVQAIDLKRKETLEIVNENIKPEINNAFDKITELLKGQASKNKTLE